MIIANVSNYYRPARIDLLGRITKLALHPGFRKWYSKPFLYICIQNFFLLLIKHILNSQNDITPNTIIHTRISINFFMNEFRRGPKIHSVIPPSISYLYHLGCSITRKVETTAGHNRVVQISLMMVLFVD